MQPDFVTRGGNHNRSGNQRKIDQILKEQKTAIEIAKQNRAPILVVEYTGHSSNDVLAKAVEGYPRATFMKKNTDGMFSKYNQYYNDLTSYIKKNDIDQLVVMGANGGGCVESSIQGALESELRVLAYTPGIADFNFIDFIYPYPYLNRFNPKCERCRFEETSDPNVLRKALYQVSIQTAPSLNKREVYIQEAPAYNDDKEFGGGMGGL